MSSAGKARHIDEIMPEPELKRVLKLPAVAFIAVGFMIGGGVFVFTGIVYKMTGPALPLAYALAAVPVFASMLPLAMLGSALPATGANYRYPSRMVSPGLAFVGIWVYAWASFFGQIPLYAIGCATYVRSLLPGISVTGFAVALVTFFYLVNLLGVRMAALLQALLVIILVCALIYYSAAGLAMIHPQNFSELFQKGSANLLLGTALLTFTYFGANGIIELGGEIVNPGKVIPGAFFIALPLVMLIYVGVALATVGAAPAGMLGGSCEPLIQVCRQISGRAGVFFFTVGGAVLALTTTLNALFIVGTKSLLMMAADGLLPSKMGRLNKRFATAHVLLTIIWVLSVIGIVSGLSLETLASYAALGGLIIFLPVQIAAMRLPVLYRQQYQQAAFKLRGWQLWFCTLTGIAMVIFFSIVILADLRSMGKIGWFAAFVLSGIAYYQQRKKKLAARGIRIADLLKQKELHDV